MENEKYTDEPKTAFPEQFTREELHALSLILIKGAQRGIFEIAEYPTVHHLYTKLTNYPV